MNKVFIDTSGWASLFDGQQPYHQLAVSEFKQLYQNQSTLITSNYIITELVALLHRPLRILFQWGLLRLIF